MASTDNINSKAKSPNLHRTDDHEIHHTLIEDIKLAINEIASSKTNRTLHLRELISKLRPKTIPKGAYALFFEQHWEPKEWLEILNLCEVKHWPQEAVDSLIRHTDLESNPFPTITIADHESGSFGERRIDITPLAHACILFEANGSELPAATNILDCTYQSFISSSNQAPHHLDRAGLAKEIKTFTWPLHFVDFESIAPPIPFFKGAKPYEGFTFQFSHHILQQDGRLEHLHEHLGLGLGVDPTFELIRHLYEALSTDRGSVFIYSQHGNTYLRYARRQLLKHSPYSKTETKTLIRFIESIATPSSFEPEEWTPSERQFKDIARTVRNWFWHPSMQGSTSVQIVLPAVLEASPFLQRRYGTARYGSPEMKSLNFPPTVWFRRDSRGQVINPYDLLSDIQQIQWGDQLAEIEGLYYDETIANGYAAMTAWNSMQFADMSETNRHIVKSMLRQHCELDTLAMVMIMEFFLDEASTA